MTLQPTELLTEHEARRLTERIRTALDRVSTAWADLAERIGEAYERRADLALGYSSWAEYAETELKPPSALAAEVRRELVGLLSARGMSTRAIAPTVGVGQTQIRRDQVSQDGSPQVGSAYPPDHHVVPDVPPGPAERIDFATGEVIRDQRAGTIPPSSATDVEEQDTGMGMPPAPRPAPITGLDGKQYTRPEPRSSDERRRPWPQSADEAAAKLDRLVTTIKNLSRDDRFPRYKNEAPRFRKSLAEAIDALQRVHDQLTEGVSL